VSFVNKSELIDTIADQVGGRAAAAKAVEAALDSIVSAAARGEGAGLGGLGRFEKRTRGARTARKMRTGANIKVKATAVPALREGAGA